MATKGGRWIRDEKRLAIYARDGFACVWCAASIESATLSLDHVKPRSNGGHNAESNLVTACFRCNSSRGKRSAAAFAIAVAAYLNHGVLAADILAHVHKTRRRVINRHAAAQLIAARGSFTLALKGDRS